MKLKKNIFEQKWMKPSEFMRNQHPDLYSDSQCEEVPSLTHNQLEYHLNTLTNRSEETVFEHFCRHLLEAEVCPNLIPQTGPTGGGDSKVDSETYPVSEKISERWYVGSPKESSSERWGFAFQREEGLETKMQKRRKKNLRNRTRL